MGWYGRQWECIVKLWDFRDLRRSVAQVEAGIIWNKTRSYCLPSRADESGKTLRRNDVRFLFLVASGRRSAGAGSGRKECQTACKPGSVPAPCGAMDDHSSGTSVAGRLARPTRTAAAETPPGRTGPEGPAGRPPLCGLAPGGVCLPPPLPAARCALTAPFHPCRRPRLHERAPAVCSLWHFPWGRPRRALPGTVFPWSPDFPPPGPEGSRSGHPAVWRLLARRLRASRQPSRWSSPASRAAVSASGWPSISAGRKWRWKAWSAAVVAASRAPLGATS